MMAPVTAPAAKGGSKRRRAGPAGQEERARDVAPLMADIPVAFVTTALVPYSLSLLQNLSAQERQDIETKIESIITKQMDEDMVVRGLAVRTREAYLEAVGGLAKHYSRRPDEIDEAQVQRYIVHLLQERKLAWSSCNVVLQGLKFFYRVTLKRRSTEFYIPTPRQPQKLPQILSPEEVARIIEHTVNPKHRTLLMTAYGTGLRLSELCHLKVSDIDAQRMTVRVEQGKGAKDRYTLLSVRLLKELREYWAAFRPRPWMFTSSAGTVSRCGRCWSPSTRARGSVKAMRARGPPPSASRWRS